MSQDELRKHMVKVSAEQSGADTNSAERNSS
jgi:hypothetical protein